MATSGTFTSSDGVRLAFTDSGPATGDGRTVVLVAGYAMPAARTRTAASS